MQTISLESLVQISNTTGNLNNTFKLIPVGFGTASAPIYVQQISTKIDEGDEELVDLSNLGFSPVRALIVKSTRPIQISIDTGTESYVSPYVTYWMFLLDSKEDNPNSLVSINLAVAAEPSTQPSPIPPGYPAAYVDLILVTDEG